MTGPLCPRCGGPPHNPKANTPADALSLRQIRCEQRYFERKSARQFRAAITLGIVAVVLTLAAAIARIVLEVSP